MKNVVLVGYSGHSFVVADAFLAMGGVNLMGYFEQKEKENNPFHLPFLGWEGKEESLQILKEKNTWFFACVGSNRIRSKVVESLLVQGFQTLSAIHPGSCVSKFASVEKGTLIASGARVNVFAKVGKGVILNTGSIVEHECQIEDYVHIAPGAVLAGDVKIGKASFVGANAVIREGITIGKNVTIGAGSVIVKDVPDYEIWIGNPGKKLEKDAK